MCSSDLVTGRGVGGLQLLNNRTRLDRLTALRLWCDSAWFCRKDNQFGRIEPGMLADLAVLSDDYFSVDENEIDRIESVLTVLGGRVVHASAEFAQHDPQLPALQPAWSPVNHFPGITRRN